VLVGRLAAHHLAAHLRQRRLRSSYQTLVTAAPASALAVPAVALEPAERWPAELAPALEALRAECAAAMAHTVDLLGSGPVALGAEIDWHRDFKSGYRWPKAFYQDVVVTRLDDASDAKVPWELSRCHQLLALGRAAAIFTEEAAASELERQLASWIDANPPGVGINWTNAMEVAIRAVSWVWAIACVENLRPLQGELRAEVSRSLAVHARHIWHNLEGSPELRSNHYLSDVVGLLVLGAVLPDDPRSARWLGHARRALEREARTQVLPDGLDFEASLSYHGLVAELLLVARWISHRAGRPLSREFDATLRRMLHASLILRHPDGRIPQFGDCDSGRILPAGWRRPPTHDHLLWIGAAMLGTTAPGAIPHEEVALNLGTAAWRQVASAAIARASAGALPAAHSFPDGGVHVLRTSRSHLCVRCGNVGQNGNGGHSHNDLLSYELSLAGRLVVADPGTYVYTSDPAARNRFRATAAHSTAIVDGEEVNPFDPAQLFRLPQSAHPLPAQVAQGDRALTVRCGHDGYRRLSPPVAVRRTFALSVETAELTVVDELEGPEAHDGCSRIQLAPGWLVVLGDGSHCELAAGDRAISVQALEGASLHVEEGWVSPRFGVREAAVRLRVRPAAQRSRFGYRIGPAERP